MTTRPADTLGLDHAAVRDSFSRAAATYDAAAVLQANVRNELLDRLQLVKLRPAVVVDLGAGTGHAALAAEAPLSQQPRRRRWTSPHGMLREAGRRQTLAATLRPGRRRCRRAAVP